MSTGAVIREAIDADLDAILAIYNTAILESTAIWVDEVIDRADREAWFAGQQAAGHPVFVAEVDGVTVGYSSYGPWRAKYGFRFSVENSVYVANGYQGRGIGRTLMVTLIDHARAAGMHLMVADIEGGNLASISLHESLGFVETGNVKEVGYKFGRWLDMAILQLTL